MSVVITLLEVKSSKREMIPQGGISLRSHVEEPTTVSQPDGAWSQAQQKALEAALLSVPKSVEDRWNVIADNVPGKSKVCSMAPAPFVSIN